MSTRPRPSVLLTPAGWRPAPRWTRCSARRVWGMAAPWGRASEVAIAKRIAPARFFLFGAVFVAAAVAAVMFGVPPRIALLIGFDLAAIVFLAALAPLLNDDAATMRRTAAANDARRGGLLVLTVMLSLVILVAVGTLIAGKSTLDWPAIALIVVT